MSITLPIPNQVQPNQTVQIIAKALHYVKQFVGNRILIKLGGSILDDHSLIEQLCADLSLLRACGIVVVLVHGGSKAINRELSLHQIESQFHEGQRITTDQMIDLIEKVLCGQVNKTLVRALNAMNVPAVGLAGTDQHMLLCTELNTILQRVGQIQTVNSALLENFLVWQQQSRNAAIPVVAPIGVNHQGQAMNINADWAASSLATHLKMDKLIYLTDQDGVLDSQGNLFTTLSSTDCQRLIDDQIISGGMLTKVKTILYALSQGLNNIHIINGRRQHSLIEELFTESGVGTICHA